ncbi:MAG: hypothetical protein U0Y10_15305 [Spirosomataceae bacterium]
MENQTPVPAPSDNGKTVAIISYLTLVGLIIAFVLYSSNKTALGAFHLRQTLLLYISGIVIAFVNIIPILGQIVWFVSIIALFIFWLMGLISALNGEMKPIPVIGEKAQELFSGI